MRIGPVIAALFVSTFALMVAILLEVCRVPHWAGVVICALVSFALIKPMSPLMNL